MNRILIVEDEITISRLIAVSLRRAGYDCTVANDGSTAADLIAEHDFDLALLDIMLPGLDGYELLGYLRPLGVPVIFITAKGATKDRVRGLQLGADDYIVKPFEIEELLARVEAVLRRTGRGGQTLTAFDVTMDIVARTVTRQGKAVELTPREFDLLEQLMRNRGAALYRDVLYGRVWGGDLLDSRTLDLHIQRLRKKLGWADKIETVYRVGYRLKLLISHFQFLISNLLTGFSMKFSQKLVCIMLLVIAAFFAVGGAVLVNGSFMDRLSAAAEQEQSMHAMLCGVVEDYYLDQTGRGEDTCGDDFITAATWRAGDLARGVYSQGLFRASADPAQDEAYAIYGLQDGQSILQYGPNVTRTYRSDLLGGLVMVTTFDVTEIFAARNRSLQRFFLLEAAVVAGAAVVVWLVSRRLTHPLTVLTAASARIAAGDYALRTRMHTGDELEILSQGFDQMAGAVQDKVEALELSVQQRDDFVGAFTHELKTPMTGIIGYADLLRSMQPDPEEQREAAGAIFHEAQRLEALSGKLLQLMGLGEHAPQLVPVQLDSVFAEAHRAVAPALNGCILTMQSNGLTVQGDADLLCDLVINLVTNAAKASTPGSTIAVCAEQADGSIRLTVQDHGQGIPADKLPRVVEPFYMVDKSRSRRQGGSGLGLALCSRIAQAHGGTLAMESELGKGTTVTVTLPAPNQTAAELAQEEPV